MTNQTQDTQHDDQQAAPHFIPGNQNLAHVRLTLPSGEVLPRIFAARIFRQARSTRSSVIIRAHADDVPITMHDLGGEFALEGVDTPLCIPPYFWDVLSIRDVRLVWELAPEADVLGLSGRTDPIAFAAFPRLRAHLRDLGPRENSIVELVFVAGGATGHGLKANGPGRVNVNVDSGNSAAPRPPVTLGAWRKQAELPALTQAAEQTEAAPAVQAWQIVLDYANPTGLKLKHTFTLNVAEGELGQALDDVRTRLVQRLQTEKDKLFGQLGTWGITLFEGMQLHYDETLVTSATRLLAAMMGHEPCTVHGGPQLLVHLAPAPA